jgi:hypothetical protein
VHVDKAQTGFEPVQTGFFTVGDHPGLHRASANGTFRIRVEASPSRRPSAERMFPECRRPEFRHRELPTASVSPVAIVCTKCGQLVPQTEAVRDAHRECDQVRARDGGCVHADGGCAGGRLLPIGTRPVVQGFRRSVKLGAPATA